MNPEIKPVLIIVLITAIIIIVGLSLTKDGPAKAPEVTINPDILVASSTPLAGIPNAKVSIVEFADFACPACAVLSPNLKEIMLAYGDSVSLSLRLLPIHGKESINSAIAAFAAGQQNNFFQYGDILFAKQSEWVGKSNQRELFISYASLLSLDIAKFTADLDSKNLATLVEDLIAQDNRDARSMNIQSTPTMIINSKTVIVGGKSVAALKALIDAELALTGTATSSKSTGSPTI